MKSKGLTNTSLFLVPALEIGGKKLQGNGFINAFLNDISHEIHYEDSIYILFKPHNLDVFQHFLTVERERITIIEDYDYEEYVVVVYKIPQEYMEDFQKFLEGKYSHFSERFMEKFEKVDGVGKPTLQWEVFTKSEKLKEHWEKEFNVVMESENEVWGMPDMSKEVLDIEQIKENVEH